MTDTLISSSTEESWHKHLEFIEAVITRMAQNSYLLKGWTITLVAATFALSLGVANTANTLFLLAALIPTIAFAFLDAFYLRQERLFRKLYEDVRKRTSSVEVFSMNTEPYKNKVDSVVSIAITVSILPFYVPVGVLILIATAVRFWLA